MAELYQHQLSLGPLGLIIEFSIVLMVTVADSVYLGRKWVSRVVAPNRLRILWTNHIWCCCGTRRFCQQYLEQRSTGPAYRAHRNNRPTDKRRQLDQCKLRESSP